ncbi:tetratricopeptide repeat protein [Dankookia sp. GCM10030260]|uniref:tetratricopeptide repeat protein n=1 Tax=Dankookia sp. GCM10030260 TaxID=3273390 RepID=UPI00361D5B1B
MQFPGPSPRLALLAAALLSACAAGGAPGDRGPRSATGIPVTGAFGAYLTGRFAAAETDTGTAADALLTALKADPDQPEVLNRAFLAALLDGRAEAQRLARRLPDNPAANLLLAGTDIQAGRWDKADQRVRALGRNGPVQVLQPTLLAWIQLGRGQPDQAMAVLRPLADQNRLRALNALHAALIADIANRPKEAERFARMAVADQPQPSWRLAVLSAGILQRAGKPQEAQRLLDQLLASGDDAALAATESNRRVLLAGRGVASPAEGWAEAYTALASALRAQGSADFALVLAQLAVRLRPGFAPALALTADALADQGHDEQALATLGRIAADDPLAPVIGLRRAMLLDKLDRTEEAVALLRRLAESYPSMPQASARLGDMLRRRNRFAEAAVAYDQALSRTAAGDRDWALLYARGIARERSGDGARAEADFLRALEIAPEQPYVLNYLGYTWAEQGKNLDRAKAMLLRATELRPQDGNIADSLGWVLFRLGDLPGAVTWLEKAVELESRNSVINDHLGDAYWAIGRQREARFQWSRAATMEPEPEELVKIAAKLKDGLPGYPASTAQR